MNKIHHLGDDWIHVNDVIHLFEDKNTSRVIRKVDSHFKMQFTVPTRQKNGRIGSKTSWYISAQGLKHILRQRPSPANEQFLKRIFSQE